MLSSLLILAAVGALIHSNTIAIVEAIDVPISTFTSGIEGVRVIGISGSLAGNSVAQIGDYDNDGIDDFAVSSSYMTVNSLYGAGLVVIVIGQSGSWTEIDLTTVTSGANTRRIYSSEVVDFLGSSVGTAGDVNNDGYVDILISAPALTHNGLSDCGAVFVVFGLAGPYTDLVLDNNFVASSAVGFVIFGSIANGQLGIQTSNTRGILGDMNGDGIDDFAISSPMYPIAGRTRSGGVWIINGINNAAPVNIELATLGSKGILLGGPSPNAAFGFSIDGVGDFNGDNIVDLIVGAPDMQPVVSGTTRTNAGVVYLILGSLGMAGRDMLSFTSGSSGARFLGATEDIAGYAVSGAGDINGDNKMDILIGATGLEDGVGKVYVVFGTSTVYTADVDLLLFTASTAGYRVLGGGGILHLGDAVSRAGDANQDGVGDFLVASSNGTGLVSIVYGTTAVPVADLILANSPLVCTFLGTQDSQLGYSVFGGYDVNGDNIPDIVMGATYATVTPDAGGAARVGAGAAYLLLGPFSLPTLEPTSAPSSQPSVQPSSRPSAQPTLRPTTQPSAQPTTLPTAQPTTTAPTEPPSARPSTQPTRQPSAEPTAQPSARPSVQPSAQPTSKPSSSQPTSMPTTTHAPSAAATVAPSTVSGTDSDGSSPALSDGGIAGVVVGGVMFLLFLIAAIVLGAMYCSPQGAAAAPAPVPTSEVEMA